MTGQLSREFSEIAVRNLGVVLKGIEAVSFYENVVRNIDKGHDYTPDIKVFKKAGANLAREVALEAIAEYREQIAHAWDLPQVMQDAVQTIVKSKHDPAELLPRYDVQYVFNTNVGKLTVRITTKHLNATVAVTKAGSQRNYADAVSEAEQWLSTYWMMRDMA